MKSQMVMKTYVNFVLLIAMCGLALSLQAQQREKPVQEEAGELIQAQRADQPLVALELARPDTVETTRAIIRPVHLSTPEAFNRMIEKIEAAYHVYPERKPAKRKRDRSFVAPVSL